MGVCVGSPEFCVGSVKVFRYQHVCIGNVKSSRWGCFPTPDSNAKGLALQWNIGFKEHQHAWNSQVINLNEL